MQGNNGILEPLRIVMKVSGEKPNWSVDPNAYENNMLIAFDDSAIRFSLVVFITDFRDYITVTDELNEDVYRNLCKAGIEIPFNKLDVYIKDDNGGPQ